MESFYVGSHYIYDTFIFFLSKLSEKAYKRRPTHCDRKSCPSFSRFSCLAKSLNIAFTCIIFWRSRIIGENPVSDFQVSSIRIFVLKTVHEPIRVQRGDPSLEVRVAATNIAQSICKRLSVKSRLTPLFSITKGVFGGFLILYSS